MSTIKEPKTPKVKTPKVKTPETITYHKTHTMKVFGGEVSFEAVLEPKGVVFKINGEIIIPVALPPNGMIELEAQILEDSKIGIITDLVWGEEVTITKTPKKGWVYVTPTE